MNYFPLKQGRQARNSCRVKRDLSRLVSLKEQDWWYLESRLGRPWLWGGIRGLVEYISNILSKNLGKHTVELERTGLEESYTLTVLDTSGTLLVVNRSSYPMSASPTDSAALGKCPHLLESFSEIRLELTSTSPGVSASSIVEHLLDTRNLENILGQLGELFGGKLLLFEVRREMKPATF